MSRSDKHQVLGNMARKGLLLSADHTTEVRAEGDHKRCSSCIYLRPFTAKKISMEALHDRTGALARRCRCNTCAECLR